MGKRTMLQRADYLDLMLINEPGSLEVLRERCPLQPQRYEDKIVGYLSADLSFMATGVSPYDRFQKKEFLSTSFTWKSDGTWIWTNAVELYVRHYHFRISEDFIRHMIARNWAPPSPDKIDFRQVNEAYHQLRTNSASTQVE